MKLFPKKAVILLLALITVVVLAGASLKGKYQFPFAERVVTTIIAPISSVMTNIGYKFRKSVLFVGNFFTLYKNNQQLITEKQQLQKKLVHLQEVEAENARLRDVLSYKSRVPQYNIVTAAVIARDPASWMDMIVIDRGSAEGIRKDMPVVTHQGLVGNVIQVFNHSAKVQLVLSPRSSVGGLVQRNESRIAAIIVGNGTKPLSPRMINLARDADIVKDDVVITSGFGGIYPKGILIGQVKDIVEEEGGLLKYAVLKPAVNFDRLEEVMVIIKKRDLPSVSKGAPL